MIKNILAVAIVAALSACSSSDSGDGGSESNGGNNGNGGATPLTPTTPLPVVGPGGGGEGPVTDTKAGSYVGTFGGAEGVYVINNDFDLAGLAIDADGSAQSLFGNVGAGDAFSGSLRQYLHQESRPNGASGSFGSIAGLVDPLSIDVNIVNGQTITSTAASDTSVSLLGTTGSAVTPATVESLAGSWEGIHSFCTDGPDGQLINCQLLTTTLNFNGTDVTGSTVVTDADGVDALPVLIAGGITEFGDAALIDFTWGDAAGYSGVVFFTPSADGRVVFVGERVGEDNPTLSAVMSQQ